MENEEVLKRNYEITRFSLSVFIFFRFILLLIAVLFHFAFTDEERFRTEKYSPSSSICAHLSAAVCDVKTSHASKCVSSAAPIVCSPMKLKFVGCAECRARPRIPYSHDTKHDIGLNINAIILNKNHSYSCSLVSIGSIKLWINYFQALKFD